MSKLQRLRNRAVQVILSKADSTVPMLVDYHIDDSARNLLDLPARPEGQEPYEGWLVDEPEPQDSSMKTSVAGVGFIKQWEGFRSQAYLCPGNVWTIGYGHTKGVKQGDRISKLKAEQLLRQDLGIYENAVNTSVTVPLNQNQFDALVSFCYNVGVTGFKKSTLLIVLNQGDYRSVPFQLNRWVRGGGRVLPGLTKRRQAEGKLFTA